ncbi:hypothetical protein, partial [Bifidobacterium vespertilionis]|uniref:hypothetical protein n=2 Tax=Bifidobacterium vespertilionis TaxID=2562524 RepID=UPI0037C1B145
NQAPTGSKGITYTTTPPNANPTPTNTTKTTENTTKQRRVANSGNATGKSHNNTSQSPSEPLMASSNERQYRKARVGGGALVGCSPIAIPARERTRP